MATVDDENPRQGYLRQILSEGAERLGAEVSGPPVYSWRDRTIGAPATGRHGACWLRATAERREWAGGDAWTGALDANALVGIPRPYLLAQTEWSEANVEIYVQLMTLAPGTPCSLTPELREEIDLPQTWWTALSQALAQLAKSDAGSRYPREEKYVVEDIRARFGDWTPTAPMKITTAHCDLHWANLMAPGLCILDWEFWRPAEEGLDAASLYCHSLLVPPVAEKVHDTFAATLESPSGVLAQLSVITHILRRADGGDYPEYGGDYPDLVRPLRRLADQLLDRRPARTGDVR